MADELPLHEAQLIALFMESILYGIFLVSFAVCMRVLLFSVDSKRDVNKKMVVVAVAMATFATLSLSFQLRHVLDAFIWYQGPGGALAEFRDISYWVNVMQTVCYLGQAIVADLVLIYRCYVVYNRRWLVIAFPLLVWIASLVTSSFLIAVTSDLKSNATINESHIVPWITSTAALTLTQTVFTTSLIAYRIWTIDRSVSNLTGRSASRRRIIRVIIESGAIYTLSLIIFLILYICGNNAQYPITVCIEQIIGIVFNSIIIRVHQGRTADQEARSTTQATSLNLGTHSTVSHTHSLGSLGKAHLRSSASDNYTMQPLQVNVHRQVIRDIDADSTFGEGSTE